MNILAVVVTYYPEEELLIKNISAFIKDVQKVLIWENTPESEKESYRFINHDKVEYCGDGINSISHGLNYGWKYAKENGFIYLLTMDQDSIFEDFGQYLCNTVYNENIPLGLFGPRYFGAPFEGAHEVHATITSGMLIKTSLIDEIGGWNEFFAIDCVDDEFCLRAGMLGVKTFLIGDSYLNQRLGSRKVVNFFNRDYALREDAPKRLYSIYKSHIVLIRLFPNVKILKSDFCCYWLKLILFIIMFEDNKVRKFYSALRGIISGFMVQLKMVRK